MKLIVAALAAGSCLVLPATADEARWKGEGSFSAGVNTGNTETSDLGIGLKIARESQGWKNSAEFIADYGTKNGSQTKNRLFAAGQTNCTLNDDAFVFARVSHEVDEFSAFDSRSFIGGGAGWQVLDGPAAKWSLEGGPGLKFDKVKEITSGTPPVIVPGRTDESFSFIAASKFGITVNDAVKLGNDTSLLYADTSTQIGNKSTLSAHLTKSLSARFSFEVRHETDPKPGFEPTDTATRMSVVYAFGG
jgi:putative salt-induced outer membrane protein